MSVAHKRRSSVTKIETDTIGSQLIQVANYNAPRKFKFHFLNFNIALLNSIFRIDLVPTRCQGFMEGSFDIQTFPSQGKYVCDLFGERRVRIYGRREQK